MHTGTCTSFRPWSCSFTAPCLFILSARSPWRLSLLPHPRQPATDSLCGFLHSTASSSIQMTCLNSSNPTSEQCYKHIKSSLCHRMLRCSCPMSARAPLTGQNVSTSSLGNASISTGEDAQPLGSAGATISSFAFSVSNTPLLKLLQKVTSHMASSDYWLLQLLLPHNTTACFFPYHTSESPSTSCTSDCPAPLFRPSLN